MIRSALTVTIVLALVGCTKDQVITTPFNDSFDRKALGNDYHNTGGPYRVDEGKLRIRGAYNKPLWLKRKLPRDAVIEFDVTSYSDDGDIKVEVWGDGESYATSKGAYLATSYVFIFGGWGNRVSALCRLDEHSPDRITRKDTKVVKGRTYHWKISRKGNLVNWDIDGKHFLKMNDQSPLEGPRHSYLGFNNWASDISFDNLKITPLK
jgi:hypothetical protein